MKRNYEFILEDHFVQNRQMAFLAGARQVGKTTTCQLFRKQSHYINWDNEDDRKTILEGPSAVMETIGAKTKRTVVFDELHKFPNWKNFLKGFFDTYAHNRLDVIVTGSSRLDLFRKGADSLMGRYFMYRMHPVSIGEIVHASLPEHEIASPQPIEADDMSALLHYGGFPEPYLKRNRRFYNRWRATRLKLLLREDLRDTSRIYETGQVEILAELLRQQAGQLVNYSGLARKIRASQDSIRRWITELESLYFCFQIRPWSQNISRSLLKNPKVYMTDWSICDQLGSQNENFVACHLMKAVNFWQDFGYGEYGLFFLRTKDGREVDFLVVRNRKPWFIVEVTSSSGSRLSKNLDYFQARTEAPHAFEVALDKAFEPANCFEYEFPVRVSAETFLSQLP